MSGKFEPQIKAAGPVGIEGENFDEHRQLGTKQIEVELVVS